MELEFKCKKLEDIISEIEKKIQFVTKIEHLKRFPEEAIRIYTMNKVYHFLYNHSDNLLRYFIEENKRYTRIGIIGYCEYLDFDLIFMRVHTSMKNTWGYTLWYEDKVNKKTTVYPIPSKDLLDKYKDFFNSLIDNNFIWMRLLAC